MKQRPFSRTRPLRSAVIAAACFVVLLIAFDPALTDANGPNTDQAGTSAKSAAARKDHDSIRIRIGVPSRTTGAATAYVLKAMLERLFHYRVELRPGTSEAIFKGMAAKDGNFDLDPEVWLPNDRSLWKKFVEGDHTVLSGRDGFVGFEGFCVPGYVTDRYGVQSVADLRKPEIARLFASAGSDRGSIWIGPADWQQTAVNRVKARDYGFAGLFKLTTSSEKDFLPKLARAIAERRPVAFACYGPHWINDKYDLSVLTEPDPGPGCYEMRDPTRDKNWYRDSTVKCRGPIPKLYIAFSARLRQRAPDVARFLSLLRLQPEMVREWAAIIHDGSAPPAMVAERWMPKLSTFP